MADFRVYFNRKSVDPWPDNRVLRDVEDVLVDHNSIMIHFVDENRKTKAVYPVHVILAIERE